jgi:hypothetical protein
MKRFLIFGMGLVMLALNSCSTAPANTMAHGTGAQLGTVTASVTLTEDRASGQITGDTGKYGYFDKMSAALERELKGPSRNAYLQDNPGPSLAEKAYAVAVYDIIQQIKAKGGNAVDNVLSDVDKNYDPETRIETVKISITANAVNTKKKASGNSSFRRLVKAAIREALIYSIENKFNQRFLSFRLLY